MIRYPVFKRIIKRTAVFSVGAANNFTILIFNFILSWIIADFSIWGGFIYWSLIVNLSAFFISWGSKEILIRNFSRTPSQINVIWTTDISARALLFLVCIPIFFFLNGDFNLKILSIIWLLTLYISKSFDSVITYEKKFKEVVIIDTISYLTIIVFISFSNLKITVFQLIVWQIIANCIKSCFLFSVFRGLLDFKSLQFNIVYLKSSFLFFLPSCIGFIQGKADLYMTMNFLNKNELGHYQLLLNFIILFHAVVMNGLSPFIKTIYRLNKNSERKLTYLIKIAGCFLAIPYILLVKIVISNIYHIDFSNEIYILSYLLALPFILYFTQTFLFLKYELQIYAAWIYAIGAFFNICLCVFLIPIFGLKGALITNLLTQWLTLFLFYFTNKVFLPNKLAIK